MKKSLIAIALISVPSIAMAASWGPEASQFPTGLTSSSTQKFDVRGNVPEKCTISEIKAISLENIGNGSASNTGNLELWCNGTQTVHVKFDHKDLKASDVDSTIPFTVSIQNSLSEFKRPCKGCGDGGDGGDDTGWIPLTYAHDGYFNNIIEVTPLATGMEQASDVYLSVVTASFRVD
ncbi:hypothetical protein ACPV5W_12220 [Vibrio astriarenae]